MESILTTAVACLCLPLYFSLVLRSISQLQARGVLMTRWQVFSFHVTHFTGAAAVVFAASNLLSGIIGIGGALYAVNRGNFSLLLAAAFAAFLISITGRAVAKVIQQGEAEFTVSPGTSINMSHDDESPEPDTIIYLPPSDDDEDDDGDSDDNPTIISPS